MKDPLSPELEAKALELASRMQAKASEITLQLARELVSTTDATLFGETEFKLRDQVMKLVGVAYNEHLGQKKNGYVGSSTVCPQCRGTAGFHDYRPRRVLSLGGQIEFQRGYYYCRLCGVGTAPWDGAVGLGEGRQTPVVAQLTTLAGAVADSFEKGAELLEEMTGLSQSESAVQQTTESAGERIAASFSRGKSFGKSEPWPWFSDANGESVGYVAIDATGVRQQGKGGEKADGRMAYVGMVFNPVPDRERVFEAEPKPGEAMKARYVSGLYSLHEMGPLMRLQGAQVGLDRASTWVALSDGGNGLEDFLRTNFPRVEAVILDFFHATEYLGKLASALHPNDEALSQNRVAEWSRLLKEEGGDVLIATLEEWGWPPGKALAAVREEVLGYFRNQVHRMDYPTYLANGWFIGSGAVESACKTVVGRLKGSGMRWGESGAHAVCHVRALYRSEKGQWEAFWKHRQPAI